ncbi:MAG: hypothetical protein K8S55_11930, partial [Phycisphaerae bacterium]|nr:hypothetical protein [Phycisphaerae bacterium]
MRARTIFLWALAWMLVATVSPALADAPYQAEVITNDVYVRSGPNMESYPCTKLNKGDKVIVVAKRSDDWLMIKPPPLKPKSGCFSVIVQEYVKVVATNAKGQPSAGKVTGDTVRIKAAGDLRQKGFYAPQGTLSKGTTVKIIGRTTDIDGKIYYVIKPPEKVRFFIAARSVKPVALKSEPVKVEPVKVEPLKVAPAKPVTTKPGPAKAKPAKTSAEAGMSVGGERTTLKAVRALEKELVAETKKPFKKQDFPAILARAKKLNVPPTSRFRQIYDSLIIFAEDEIKLAKHRKAADLLVAKALGKPTAVVAAAKPEAAAEKQYDIQGILGLSVLYNTGAGPKRYILRNPETTKIVGYVQSKAGIVNLDAFVGKHVGIRGKATFDKTHSLRVHEADKVALIQPGGIQVAKVKPPIPPTKPAPAAPKPVPAEPTKPAPVAPKPV